MILGPGFIASPFTNPRNFEKWPFWRFLFCFLHYLRVFQFSSKVWIFDENSEKLNSIWKLTLKYRWKLMVTKFIRKVLSSKHYRYPSELFISNFFFYLFIQLVSEETQQQRQSPVGRILNWTKAGSERIQPCSVPLSRLSNR